MLIARLTGIILFGLGAACNPLSRMRECDRLAETVNSALEEIEEMLQAGSGSVPTGDLDGGGKNSEEEADASSPEARESATPDYQAIAGRYARLQAEVEALPIKDDKLKAAVESYLEMLELTVKELGATTDEAVPVPEPKKSKRDRKKQKRGSFAAVEEKERAALAKLKSACRP